MEGSLKNSPYRSIILCSKNYTVSSLNNCHLAKECCFCKRHQSKSKYILLYSMIVRQSTFYNSQCPKVKMLLRLPNAVSMDLQYSSCVAGSQGAIGWYRYYCFRHLQYRPVKLPITVKQLLRRHRILKHQHKDYEKNIFS